KKVVTATKSSVLSLLTASFLCCLLGRSTWALFCRDRLDDEAMPAFRVETLASHPDSLPHQGLDSRLIECGGRRQPDVPCYVSGPLQPPIRIGKPRSLQEKQAYPSRKDCYGEDCFRRPFAGTKADCQRVVIVINQFQRCRVTLPHLRENCFSERGYLWRKFGEE